MSGERISDPSYVLSAVGGFFLGILGVAVLMLLPDLPWNLSVVPIVGLGAALLGTYVAAEPYEELRESYDRLISDAADLARVSVDSGAMVPISSAANETVSEERGGADEAEREAVEERVTRAEAGRRLAEERLIKVGKRIEEEGAKLLTAAAALGADGNEVAGVVEVLRTECMKLTDLNSVK